ncbi:MAG: hypothetical protein AAF927_22845 [Bacteroidota bacterium]
MDNSIENIWKEGFLQDDALVAPKLNDLYNQKSQHFVERFTRMYRNNRIAILIGALVILIASILLGSPISGAILFGMFMGLNYFSRQQAKILEAIPKGRTSYQYLKEMHSSIERILQSYVSIYRWFYPTLLLVFFWGMWEVNIGEFSFKETVLEALPDASLLLGIPVLPLTFVLAFCFAFGIFAEPLFRGDVSLVYGPVLDKLEELIEDMEGLTA